MPAPLRELDEAPPAPRPVGDDTRPPRRRGRFSFAQHEKLASRLYVRADGEDVETRRLPSFSKRVTLDESGVACVIDKAEARVFRCGDGEPRCVYEADEDSRVSGIFAVGDVVWVRTGPRLREGQVRVVPETIHRVVVGDEDAGETHVAALPRTGGAFGGTEQQLAVLDEGGSVHLFTVTDEALRHTGPYDENFTGVHEWDGRIALVSHWWKGKSWIVTGAGDKEPVARELRLASLPQQARSGLERLVKDGAVDAVHRAHERLPAGASLSQREAHMKRAGITFWDAVRDAVVADVERLYGLACTSGLEQDLREATLDFFDDAARW